MEVGVIELTINGKKHEFDEGRTVLECLQDAGVKVPTLCHHKAVIPYGACRLCLVEVIQRGRTTIQTSCTYPASHRLEVKTDSERVKQSRKIMMELLLARSPASHPIHAIASEHGIT